MERGQVVRAPEGPTASWPAGKPSGSRPPNCADTTGPYVGKQSQRIQIAAAGARDGIAQGDLAVEAGVQYAARFQLKAERLLKVSARLCDASGQKEYACQSMAVEPGAWRSWAFTFRAPQTDLQARLEITFGGPGTLWVGSASLLRADSFHGHGRDVIARLKEITVPLLRWPGGNFTRDYRWKEGLLPVDQRPPIAAGWHETLPFTDNYDFHEVAIDEYIALCRELGAAPCITLTMGIAEGPQEAADWVEYCNGSARTRWGKIRAERGHPEPYRVKYWTIGNEVWGEWMGPAFYTLPVYAAVAEAICRRHAQGGPVAGADRLGRGSGLRQAVDRAGRNAVRLALAARVLQAGHTVVDRFGRRRGIHASGPTRPGRRIAPACARHARPWTAAAASDLALPSTNGTCGTTGSPTRLPTLGTSARSTRPLPRASSTCSAAKRPDSTYPWRPCSSRSTRARSACRPFSAELTAMGQVFALYRGHHGARLLETGGPGDRPIDSCASLSADRKAVCVTLVNRAVAGDRPVDLILAGARPVRATATILSAKELQPDGIMDRQVQELAIGGEGKISLVLPRFGIAMVRIGL